VKTHLAVSGWFLHLDDASSKMIGRIGFAVMGVMVIGWAGAPLGADAAAPDPVVSQGAPSAAWKPAEAAPEKTLQAAVDNSPEAIMSRRFPQKVRVGDLIGLPMLDDNDVTLGHVERVVRTPEGKIRLIVGFSKWFGWFGWFGRPVAVPIEVVAILGRQIASLDMPPAEYAAAPTWTVGKDVAIPDDDIIRIAITRR
jgi:PRC-barrel domain